jgi:hypothetical protein
LRRQSVGSGQADALVTSCSQTLAGDVRSLANTTLRWSSVQPIDVVAGRCDAAGGAAAVRRRTQNAGGTFVDDLGGDF